MKSLVALAILFSNSAFAAKCISDEKARELAWPEIQMSDISHYIVSFGDTLDRDYSFDSAKREHVFVGVGSSADAGNCGQIGTNCPMDVELEVRVSCNGKVVSATAVGK